MPKTTPGLNTMFVGSHVPQVRGELEEPNKHSTLVIVFVTPSAVYVQPSSEQTNSAVIRLTVALSGPPRLSLN